MKNSDIKSDKSKQPPSNGGYFLLSDLMSWFCDNINLTKGSNGGLLPFVRIIDPLIDWLIIVKRSNPHLTPSSGQIEKRSIGKSLS